MLHDILTPQQMKILSEEFGSIIQHFNTSISNIFATSKNMKSWSEFFEIFEIPTFTSSNIQEILQINLVYYSWNYLLIFGIIFLLRILFTPILLICIIICSVISYVFIYILRGTLSIGEYHINEYHKIILCAIFSFFFLGLCGALEHFLWSFVISLSICLLHMILRPKSASSSNNKSYEEFKLHLKQLFSMKESPSDRQQNDLDDDVDDVEATSNSHNDTTMAYNLPPGLTSGSMRKRTGK